MKMPPSLQDPSVEARRSRWHARNDRAIRRMPHAIMLGLSIGGMGMAIQWMTQGIIAPSILVLIGCAVWGLLALGALCGLEDKR